jgi:hypothetical protein
MKITISTNTRTSRTESRKRSNSSSSVHVSRKKKKTSESRSISHQKNEVNTVKSGSQEPSEQRQKANHEHGTKSRVGTQQVSVSDNFSVNVRSNAKDAEQKNKVNRKPGPKSRVGGQDDNLDNDDSDVEIVLYKPADSFLDVIDMTDDIDSPVEDVDEDDPAEGLEPHVRLIRIPEMCNIYSCSLCEGTFVTKRYANNHVCMNRKLNSASPNKDEHREKTSEDSALWKKAPKDKVQDGKVAENTAASKEVSENKAAGAKASDDNTLESEEESYRGSSSIDSTLSASSSELQKLTSVAKDAETERKDNKYTNSGGCGQYQCDVCGVRFTRHVTLVSHKDRHLYPMNEDEDSSDGIGLFNVRKKKKSVPKSGIVSD